MVLLAKITSLVIAVGWYCFALRSALATVRARRTTVNRITSLKLAAAWGIAQKFYTPGASRDSELQSVLVPKCLPTLSHEVAVLVTCLVDLRSSQHTGRAADVLGLDVSVAQLAESRRRVPGAEFDFLDIFEEADRLAALPAAARCKKVFLDIGGDRQKVQVLHAIDILRRCMPNVQLIVVKSEELHSAMASWTGCASSASNGEGVYLERPCEFLHSAEGSAAPLRLPKQRRATRVRSLVQNQLLASADPERWFSRREIEAALPSFSNIRGFCLVRDEELNAELATCLFLHHEQNPLFLDHAVCCIYADDKEVEALMQRCGKHAIPVFWGQGGGAVMQEFLGSYEIVDMLPLSHSLYEAPALCEHLQGLRRRSRRPMTGPQLLQMKYVEAARESTYPEHPCKCSDPSAWLQEILRRVHWHEKAAQVGDVACNTLPSLPFMALPCSSTKLHRQIEVRRGRGQNQIRKHSNLKGVYHYDPLPLLVCFIALLTNHDPVKPHHTSDQIILRVLVVVLASLQRDFDLTLRQACYPGPHACRLHPFASSNPCRYWRSHQSRPSIHR
ncbi:unnamed protein product [Symbiodinium sp. CCMP2456]|nr:unnamed protein product [Symbiodinium sp. CCMP2456]